MNNLLKQNKIIVVIILAALFQLVSFIFSQIVVNLDEELEKDISSFGVIELDLRDFTSEQIYRKWKEQDCLDGYTGKPLDFEDAVGDHIIPRSEGVLLGGVTEEYNLIVTSDVNNRIKSNMNPESFRKQVA